MDKAVNLSNLKNKIMKKILLACTVSLFAVACNNESTESPKENDAAAAKEMKEERNKKIIMASMEAMQKLDADAMLKDIAPDAMDYGDGSMPPQKSADSVKKMVNVWIGAMESMKADDLTMVADGDRVWVYAKFSGKFKSDMMGMPTTGKTYTIPDVDMFLLNEEGKVIEHRSVQSGEVMMRQLGIEPPKQ